MDTTMKTHSATSRSSNSLAAVMPLHTHWNAEQLADAVARRLSQLLDFSAQTLAACDRASANADAMHGTRRSTTFLPTSQLSPFRMS